MPEVEAADVTLHVELDGEGAPVTVFAHGLTNSCKELAAFTPALAGTKVRFCFRGHGHSSAPERGYLFADFARDLEKVADEYGATRAVGTSLGAGAICNLLTREPARFERLVFLLPAALDLPFQHEDMFLRTAEILETYPKDEAIERILSRGAERYEERPWLREFDLLLWQDMNPVGVARAIREVVQDRAVRDREALRVVEAPTLIISHEGDSIHPAEVGRALAGLMPRSELIVLDSEEELLASIPVLVEKVAGFLS
ncbi:MAG: alpha/beta hydrolase [Actinobacteria bacterium]|nr:alpha/beta hydrolase [Actinomycetota bacterium]